MLDQNLRAVLLITSAAQVPRALATFQRAGVMAVPARTGVEVTYPLFQSVMDLVPDADALARSTNAIKDYLGLFSYRLAGWA